MPKNTVRQFRSWLSNLRIGALRQYAARLRRALAGCPDARWVGGLGYDGVVEHFLRGSGGVQGLRHPSASVAFPDYRGMLGFAARLLKGRQVGLLADRGFIDGDLLRWAKAVSWHYRIRGKRDIELFLAGGRPLTLRLSAGELRCYAGVFLGAARLPVELAVGWEKGSREPWIIVTDASAGPDTLCDYALRFTIEENFWTINPGASNGHR